MQHVTDGRLAGTALLEMYEGDNRLAIDHGASGAPVFDCEGRIAAVISTVITQILADAIWRIANFDGMGNTQCRVGAGPSTDGIFRSAVRKSRAEEPNVKRAPIAGRPQRFRNYSPA